MFVYVSIMAVFLAVAGWAHDPLRVIAPVSSAGTEVPVRLAAYWPAGPQSGAITADL